MAAKPKKMFDFQGGGGWRRKSSVLNAKISIFTEKQQARIYMLYWLRAETFLNSDRHFLSANLKIREENQNQNYTQILKITLKSA